MGLVLRFLCFLWWFLVWFRCSSGCDYEGEDSPHARTALTGGPSEPRARHRLQLLFPLLLRISTRLATLVPTALMSLLGIILFVVFSKKALIVSLFALLLTLSDKYKSKPEEIHIHKIHSYDEYNDEEHIHYHHGPKYGKHYYYESYPPEKSSRRTLPALPHIPHPIPLGHAPFEPFEPSSLWRFTRRTFGSEGAREDTAPLLFPPAPGEEETGRGSQEWSSLR